MPLPETKQLLLGLLAPPALGQQHLLRAAVFGLETLKSQRLQRKLLAQVGDGFRPVRSALIDVRRPSWLAPALPLPRLPASLQCQDSFARRPGHSTRCKSHHLPERHQPAQA